MTDDVRTSSIPTAADPRARYYGHDPRDLRAAWEQLDQMDDDPIEDDNPIPPIAATNSTTVTFTAPGPTCDLRSLLRGVDESIAAHQAQIRHLMRMRRGLAEAADNADIDARYEAEWGVKR